MEEPTKINTQDQNAVQSALMASSATRWVRWRTKVKAHVLALICPSHRMLLGLWVAIGALVASAPGVQAEEGRALHVTDDTARHLRYTSRAKREADVSLSHRCTMEHPLHHGAPRCDGCYHPETDGES